MGGERRGEERRGGEGKGGERMGKGVEKGDGRGERDEDGPPNANS